VKENVITQLNISCTKDRKPMQWTLLKQCIQQTGPHVEELFITQNIFPVI